MRHSPITHSLHEGGYLCNRQHSHCCITKTKTITITKTIKKNNNRDCQHSNCCGIQWPAFLKTAALGRTRFTHSCSSCNPHLHPRHIPTCSSSSSSSSSSPSSSSWCETKLFVFLTWAVTRCCQASGNSHYLKTRSRRCWFYSSMLLPSKLRLLLPRLYYLKTRLHCLLVNGIKNCCCLGFAFP